MAWQKGLRCTQHKKPWFTWDDKPELSHRLAFKGGFQEIWSCIPFAHVLKSWPFHWAFKKPLAQPFSPRPSTKLEGMFLKPLQLLPCLTAASISFSSSVPGGIFTSLPTLPPPQNWPRRQVVVGRSSSGRQGCVCMLVCLLRRWGQEFLAAFGSGLVSGRIWAPAS